MQGALPRVVHTLAEIDKEGGKPNIIRVLRLLRKVGADQRQGKRPGNTIDKTRS